MSTKRKTTEQFISEALKIHGNNYDYSKVVYVNQLTKVCIICKKHGEFWQLPKQHLRGQGCPICGRIKISENRKGKPNPLPPRVKQEHTVIKHKVPHNLKNTEEFITAARKIHGNKYDYSKVIYNSNDEVITIICPEHGEFQQKIRYHLQGRGCQKCARDITKEKQKYSNDEYIELLTKIYNDTYDYSKVDYKGRKSKVTLICPKHGEFTKIASDLIHKKTGCPYCNQEKKRILFSLGDNEFINKSNEIHHGLYKYDKVKYVNNATKVVVTCTKHGDFMVTPANHLKGRGCPLCKAEKNVYEERLFYFLKTIIPENDIVKQARFDWLTNNKSLDFYIPKYKIAIEHQGSQHFMFQTFLHVTEEKFIKTQYNDKVKIKECSENGVTLFHFTYELKKIPCECQYELILREEELKNKILNEIKKWEK